MHRLWVRKIQREYRLEHLHRLSCGFVRKQYSNWRIFVELLLELFRRHVLDCCGGEQRDCVYELQCGWVREHDRNERLHSVCGRQAVEHGRCERRECVCKLPARRVLERDGRKQRGRVCELSGEHVLERGRDDRVHILCCREVIEHGWRQRRERVSQRDVCGWGVFIRERMRELYGRDVLESDGCEQRGHVCEMSGGGVFECVGGE